MVLFPVFRVLDTAGGTETMDKIRKPGPGIRFQSPKRPPNESSYFLNGQKHICICPPGSPFKFEIKFKIIRWY